MGRPESNMLAVGHVTRFEYNINGGVLWFNGSSVDGVNINHRFEYTGCPNSFKQCNIDLDTCYNSIVQDGVKTCPSAKQWANINECGGMFDMTAKQLAGCGYGDAANKEKCHKWWSTNACAQKWLNWLQKNKTGECPQYGWAYDEMRYKPGDIFDINGNPSPNKDITPLLRCDINGGSLNISIDRVL